MDIVSIEMLSEVPEELPLGVDFVLRGRATFKETLTPPPWVYLQVQKKDWYKPAIIEETHYLRDLANPLENGEFTTVWKPEKEGHWELTFVATPAPIPLPVVGVFPITGQSEMKKTVVKETISGDVSEFRITAYYKK